MPVCFHLTQMLDGVAELFGDAALAWWTLFTLAPSSFATISAERSSRTYCSKARNIVLF